MHPSAVSPNAGFCEPSLGCHRAAIVRHGTQALRLIGALLAKQHEVWSTGNGTSTWRSTSSGRPRKPRRCSEKSAKRAEKKQTCPESNFTAYFGLDRDLAPYAQTPREGRMSVVGIRGSIST
jgi:hypothetical protein